MEEPAGEAGASSYPSEGGDPIIATSTPNPAERARGVSSWALTRALSPRPSVRVAAVDDRGDVLNLYTGHARVDGTEPARPWAVYLAGTDARFRLLAFDLDAKAEGANTAAERDAATIAGLLTDAGIEHVVCQSGPSGGRHVWAALAESVDAETIATLARLTRHLCPSLDLSQLTNPVTGCVRPPGAPHRAGGASTVLTGTLDALTSPTTTAAQVRQLVERLAQLVDVDEPAEAADPRMPLPLDEHGHLYLPGRRRELPASSAAALREDAASGDASAVLWRVLIGAAAARWRHADVAALVETSPGLEHVRSSRDRSGRRTRPISGPNSAAAVLRRQWRKAVRYVATSDRQIGDDPTFDARADAIAAHVREVQTRADASIGRWTHGGGPADRRVLDVLCLLALQALSGPVEADTRRLALLAGVGRETARTGLLRLAADGWIAQAGAADGPHGARWTIDPQGVLHREPSTGRSQADPRPAGAGAAERTALLTILAARTSDDAQDVDELARATGSDPARTLRTLDRLVSAGLLVQLGNRWARPSQDRRRAAAERLGVDGRLQRRAAAYTVERELWAWWQAEQTWMQAPRRPGAGRRPGRGQLTLLPEFGTSAYGAHPRRADGRADYRAARTEVEQERGGRAIAPRRSPAPAVVAVEPPSDAERIIIDILGARLIAVEPYAPAQSAERSDVEVPELVEAIA